VSDGSKFGDAAASALAGLLLVAAIPLFLVAGASYLAWPADEKPRRRGRT
jgi:hypothetical protein